MSHVEVNLLLGQQPEGTAWLKRAACLGQVWLHLGECLQGATGSGLQPGKPAVALQEPLQLPRVVAELLREESPSSTYTATDENRMLPKSNPPTLSVQLDSGGGADSLYSACVTTKTMSQSHNLWLLVHDVYPTGLGQAHQQSIQVLKGLAVLQLPSIQPAQPAPEEESTFLLALLAYLSTWLLMVGSDCRAQQRCIGTIRISEDAGRGACSPA